jgi:hypothetical protein
MLCVTIYYNDSKIINNENIMIIELFVKYQIIINIKSSITGYSLYYSVYFRKKYLLRIN